VTLAGDDAALRSAAGDTLSVDPESVALTSPTEGSITLTVDGDWVGRWPSRTALVADLATESVLVDEPRAGLDRLERASRLGSADRPTGVGSVTPGRTSPTTVSSCCGSAAVVAVDCATCDARLAEFDPSPVSFPSGR
jgi:hypothetical protein